MEIFDSAISKAKEVIGVVTQKTGEAVTTGKQKFDISSLEVKLKKDFECLGKLYYEMIKDQETDDETVAKTLADIKEKKEQIKAIRVKLNATKNKRFCPECGAAIEEDSVYCNFCGVELIYETKTEE